MNIEKYSGFWSADKYLGEFREKLIRRYLPIGEYSKISVHKEYDSVIMGITYRFGVIYPLEQSVLNNFVLSPFTIVSLPNVHQKIIDEDHSYVVSSISKYDLTKLIEYFVFKGVDSQTVNIAYMLSRMYDIPIGKKISLNDFYVIAKMCDITDENIEYVKTAIVNKRIPFLQFIAYPPANYHMPVIERIVHICYSLLEMNERGD